jgi:predicted nucleotidyltransferase
MLKHGTNPRIVQERLVTEPILKKAISTLIKRKREGEELDSGPRIDPISEYIEKELERFENYQVYYEKVSVPIEKLDEVFLSTLYEVWGSL